MRFTLLFAFLFLSNGAYAQTETVRLSPSFIATMDKVYLDSVEIDLAKTYLDSANILEINAIKSRDAQFFSTNRSAILITRKTHTPLMSLGAIKVPPLKPVQYVINGKHIADTTNVRIETSVIDAITILKDAEGNVVRESMPVTIMIQLKTKRKNDQ